VFAAIGRFAVRFRWFIVAAWVVAAVAGVRLLPNLASVTQASNTQFLSSSSPSVQAGKLAAPFQTRDPAATAIVVATRGPGPLTSADLAALDRVEQAVRQVPDVTQVTDLGRSKDGSASQAVVSVTSAAANGSDAAKKMVVDNVRATFTQAGAPPGLSFHLTGPLAVTVDGNSAATGNGNNITRFTLLFVVVLLFIVYRAALAPLITLVPAALAVVVAGLLAAQLAKAGLAVASIAQLLLIVLILGAGSDYGLFLTFRFREELAGGAEPKPALIAAVARVGEAITYSGLTVAAALVTLLIAPFGLFRGLGPALAIGIGVTLVASLTLTPALLAIFGRIAFWPVPPQVGPPRISLWGRVAERVVRRPVLMLVVGALLFGALAAGLVGYRTGGLTSSVPSGSDSAAGIAVLTAHFPSAAGGDQLLLRYPASVRDDPAVLSQVQARLSVATVFSGISGPLVSPDGRTLQFSAALRAGPAGSAAAAAAIPAATTVMAGVASASGADAYGVAGQDAAAYDITTAANTSLLLVVPVVLVLILILLGLLLRSLVAPWYLALTVGLSYFASLGFAMLVFVHLGRADGLIFVLPLLLFVFAMALGEDYNILVMSRIREEARNAPTLAAAITRAIGITGGTVTSAGIILAGTFLVLGLAGGRTDAQQLGFSIAFGVLLDTFFVRTLLVPSIATLLGRWNWWPSRLSTLEAARRA
jgi:RND superfamily putative drug exporter